MKSFKTLLTDPELLLNLVDLALAIYEFCCAPRWEIAAGIVMALVRSLLAIRRIYWPQKK